MWSYKKSYKNLWGPYRAYWHPHPEWKRHLHIQARWYSRRSIRMAKIGYRYALIYSRWLIQHIDRIACFLCRRNYDGSNSALAEARMPLVAGGWTLLVFVVVTLLWGVAAPIDSAAVAHGNVVLLSNKKTVQHLEGGIIEALYIKEGDFVQQGQPLIRLSDTIPKSNLGIIQGELWAAKATEARLIAEREDNDSIDFPRELQELAGRSAKFARIIAIQNHLFESEVANLHAQIGVLQERIAQSEEEIGGLNAQIEGTDGQLELLDKEIDQLQELLEQHLVPNQRLLALERNRHELEGNRGQYTAAVARAKEVISETKMHMLSVENDFSGKKAQELRDVQVQISDWEEKQRAAQDVVNRTLITAPVSGIVKGMKYFTIGGVIEPRTAIMDIIPQNDQLIVEAHVQPNDIDIVHPNMAARIMLTAYKSRITPRLDGKVTQVSADKFTDGAANSGSASYYIARVEIDASELKALAHPVELYPGMPADVMIISGTRSFVGYLLKPLSDSMHRAFREK